MTIRELGGALVSWGGCGQINGLGPGEVPAEVEPDKFILGRKVTALVGAGFGPAAIAAPTLTGGKTSLLVPFLTPEGAAGCGIVLGNCGRKITRELPDLSSRSGLATPFSSGNSRIVARRTAVPDAAATWAGSMP
jgi:hypothetical protein